MTDFIRCFGVERNVKRYLVPEDYLRPQSLTSGIVFQFKSIW